MTTTFQNLSFSYPDQMEFDTLIQEVFKDHSYYVDLATQTPLIIDAGAHIGTSVLYFHKQYPRARFICIEPNPQNLHYLQLNLAANSVTSVQVIPKALVGARGGEQVPLYLDPTWGVFASLLPGGWTKDRSHTSIRVPTIKLSEIITEPVDILKMDIEGMEMEVLMEAGESLRLVSHCVLEFHQTRPGELETMQRFLARYFSDIEIEKDPRREKRKEHQLYTIKAHRTT